jgi:hypothetical protein
VTDLLKAKGVDLNNNRFLILQVRCTLPSIVRLLVNCVGSLATTHAAGLVGYKAVYARVQHGEDCCTEPQCCIRAQRNMQGEVEQIAMMKPKGDDKNETGLLEYLEDIIGTDQYKQPIEEAAAKLEELNDQRQTAVHRVKRAGVLTFCPSLHFCTGGQRLHSFH